MLLNNVLFSLEFVAAVITILFIGRLLILGKDFEFLPSLGGISPTKSPFIKRSLLNQQVNRRAVTI